MRKPHFQNPAVPKKGSSSCVSLLLWVWTSTWPCIQRKMYPEHGQSRQGSPTTGHTKGCRGRAPSWWVPETCSQEHRERSLTCQEEGSTLYCIPFPFKKITRTTKSNMLFFFPCHSRSTFLLLRLWIQNYCFFHTDLTSAHYFNTQLSHKSCGWQDTFTEEKRNQRN